MAGQGEPWKNGLFRRWPGKESDMGIWIELGIFILVIAWALWQIHDVKKAQARTRAEKAREAAEQPPGPGDRAP